MNPTVRAAIVVTAVFAVIQTVATIAPDGPAAVVSVAVSLGLFAVGSGTFLWAFYIAADRSRDEAITVAGVVWLIGTAPAGVASALRWALVIQVVVAVTAASVRPFSPVAFGVLVPMFGLGSLAWYGARHGVFVTASGSSSTPDADPVDGALPSPGDPSDPGRGDRTAAPSGPDRSDPDDFDQLFRRRRRRRRGSASDGGPSAGGGGHRGDRGND